MKKTYIRWILAVIITLSAAVYQRLTGPTYPLRGSIQVEDYKVSYKLTRSHGGEGDQIVEFELPDTACQASLIYKRFNTEDEWTNFKMWRDGDFLRGQLPHQPPAGKLEYYILINKDRQKWLIPADQTVVTRFKGAVPKSVLYPHVLFMFIAMLLSTLTALEAFANTRGIFIYTFLTTFFLVIGGMIFGPIVQEHAFGAFWTGVPFGWDLTDNKTLVGVIGWLIALFFMWRFRSKTFSRWIVIGAAVVLLLVYSIPHSMMGSELDYEKMEVVTGE